MGFSCLLLLETRCMKEVNQKSKVSISFLDLSLHMGHCARIMKHLIHCECKNMNLCYDMNQHGNNASVITQFVHISHSFSAP